MNKQEIIEACKEANACKEEFKRLIKAKTDAEFIKVLQDNISWVTRNLNYSLIKTIPFDWSKLEGYDWSDLLEKQPKFSEYCEWSNLKGYDWRNLLRKQPQFSEHCDWSKLDGLDWSLLLIKQPKFAKYKK